MLRHQSFLHFALILLPRSGLAAPTPSLVPAVFVREMSLEPPAILLSGSSVSSDSDASTSVAIPAVTDVAVLPSSLSTSFSVSLSATDIDLVEASPTWTVTTVSILTITDVSGTASPTSASVDSSTTPLALDVLDVTSGSVPTSSAPDFLDTAVASLTPSSSVPTSMPTTSTFSPATLYLPDIAAAASASTSRDAGTSSSASLSTASATFYAQFSGVRPFSSGAMSTAFSNPNPTSATQVTTSQQSRKSALIAAFITLGTLIALGICILCMRCKLVARLRRLRRESARPPSLMVQARAEDFQPKSILINREKDSVIPGLPQTVMLAPFAPTMTTADGPPAPRPLDWALFALHNDGPFEDVTHMLTGPDEPSRVSGASTAATTATRTSGGGASLTAESYMTCESRYSSPSSERRSQDSGAGPTHERDSAESLALDFAFPPLSPPPPALLRTPDLSFRAASPPPSTSELLRTPNMSLPMLPKFSLPGQKALHVPSLTPSEELVVAGSEWDVADAYGARSSGASSVLNEFAENMEKVEVGGRLCVLVQGI